MTIFDFDQRGQLTYDFRFELLEVAEDGTLAYAGTIHPQVPVTINNDTTASIKRSMSQVIIPRTEVNDIDYFSMRVRPVVIVDDVEYPMGVFLWADWIRKRVNFDVYDADTSLVDQSLILDQPISQTFSVTTGTNVVNAIRALMDLLPVAITDTAFVDGSSNTIAAPLVYPIGQNTYLSILTNLAQLGGYYSPYFDSNGRLTVRSVPLSLADAETDLVIDSQIAAATIGETDNLLDAPNRYMVISTSASVATAVGVYDVPADLPHSFASRGFYVTKTIQLQGVPDSTTAAELAYAAASQDLSAQTSVTLQTPLDPRHDTFDVVSYRGANYWEKSWSAQLSTGLMSHDLKQTLV